MVARITDTSMESRQQLLKELICVRDYVRWGVSKFTASHLCFGHGTDNAWDEALHLVLHTLHLPPDVDPGVLDARLTTVERNLVLVVLETRIKERIPAAYLTGLAGFAGLQFKVDERVIIPRSPLAELIEQEFAPWLDGTALNRVLDLCCGSGCIGIATAAYLPQVSVDLVDISESALEVAQMNIERHELKERVHIQCSDLFAALDKEQKYDLIISNPPYVDAEDLANMPAEYQHEPQLALEAGADGLGFARKILRQALAYLGDDGALLVEVGNSAAALEREFPELPFTWIDFSRGGHGVFLLSAQQLREHKACLN